MNDAIQTDMNAGAEFRKVIASLHNLEILQICKFSRQNIYRVSQKKRSLGIFGP